MADDDSENGSNASSGTAQSHPRARASAELGHQFAELLAEPHASALGVCAKLRIGYTTYKTWMRADADDPETPEGVRAFQHIVLDAHEQRRVAEIEAIQRELDDLDGPRVALAGALLNKHTFHHEKRFKRFYAGDDEPKKTELDIGNKGGKPFQTSGKHGLTEGTRLAIVNSVLGVPAQAIAVGDAAGQEDMGDPEVPA